MWLDHITPNARHHHRHHKRWQSLMGLFIMLKVSVIALKSSHSRSLVSHLFEDTEAGSLINFFIMWKSCSGLHKWFTSTLESFKLAVLKPDRMQSAEMAGSPNEDTGGKCVSMWVCRIERERDRESTRYNEPIARARAFINKIEPYRKPKTWVSEH